MEIDDAYNVRVEVISLPQTGRVTPSLQLRYCSLPNGENLKPGEVLLENLYLTVNDAVLVKLKTLKPGDILRGPGISKVLFSRSAMLNEGDIVFGVEITWEKYLIINDDHLQRQQGLDLADLNILGRHEMKRAARVLQSSRLKEAQTVLITVASTIFGITVIALALQQRINVLAQVSTQKIKEKLTQLYPNITIGIGKDTATAFNQAKPVDYILVDSSLDSAEDLKAILPRVINQHQIAKQEPSENEKTIPKDFFTLYDGLDSFAAALQDVEGGLNFGLSVLRVTRLSEQNYKKHLQESGLLQPKL